MLQNLYIFMFEEYFLSSYKCVFSKLKNSPIAKRNFIKIYKL